MCFPGGVADGDGARRSALGPPRWGLVMRGGDAGVVENVKDFIHTQLHARAGVTMKTVAIFPPFGWACGGGNISTTDQLRTNWCKKKETHASHARGGG